MQTRMQRKVYFIFSVFIFILLNFNIVKSEQSVAACFKDDIENECDSLKFPDKTNFKDEPLIFTVATERTDGFRRYERSTHEYGIQSTVLGMGEPWKGGSMDHPGGGHKVNMLLKALEPWKDDDNKIAIFTDSYDVMYLAPTEHIIKQFLTTGARILFSAESYCWPDVTLADKYPKPEDGGKTYLNSGMFMGYTSNLYSLVSKIPIKDTDDDQLFYTKAYLDEEFRTKHKFQLDHKSEIFQNMDGAAGEIKLDFEAEDIAVSLLNTEYRTRPSVCHGNGPSKILLNSFGNYLANAWKKGDCPLCKTENIELKEDQYPTVGLSIFVEKPTPFLEEFFENIVALNYPKDRIHLFVHNNVAQHSEVVSKFFEVYGPEYKSRKSIIQMDNTSETAARDLAVKHCINKKCDYYFTVDADAHLDNPDTLQLLIKQNRPIIAPLLIRPGLAWSNFWGALSPGGFYARSFDYMDLVYNERKGVWNVPYISSCYLISAAVLPKASFKLEYTDPDMALCWHFRREGIFMYVTNLYDFGHLITTEQFDPKIVSPELYMMKDNKLDWVKKYINPKWIENFNPNNTAEQPCPDVYWFPVVTERFCSDLINVMESFGKWSDGSNSDERLQGGYEAVPTRDIHMSQVGLEPMWMQFLQDYVRPLQELVFTGYFHDPPRSLMNFVVRYRPDEQPFLRPHHDTSTYTINLALNRPNIDYEGGGCNFIRYKCSVTQTKIGWLLMHPGRLTHYHEGLRVTNGTRYIMVSFVDP